MIRKVFSRNQQEINRYWIHINAQLMLSLTHDLPRSILYSQTVTQFKRDTIEP